VSLLDDTARAARESGDYDPLLALLPYTRFMGMRAHLEAERVVLRLPFQPHLIGNARRAALHGGVLGACLECAALLQVIHARGLPLPKTIDFTVDYLRFAGDTELYAEAEIQRLGRRVANVRMSAYQAERDKPVALGRANFLLG
jgi:uncharacterized protein (TIGR00369 family)